MGSAPAAEPAGRGDAAAEATASGRRIPVELIPGLFCIGVFIAWAFAGGGYETTASAPGTLFLIGVLAIVLVAGRRALSRISGISLVALGFLAAFVAWNFLSISWAEVQGIAWDGANRTLLYLVVYAIFLSLSWRSGSARLVMGVYSIGLVIVGAVVLSHAIGSAEPATSLVGGTRFAEPTNYPNGVAALFIGGIWPALFLGGRRETPWPVRGVLLASAAFLLQLALLPQSRGAVIVFPLAILVYLAVVPHRLRALVFLVVVGAASALAAPTILDVFTVAEDGGDVGDALSAARDAMVVSFAGLLVVGMLIGLADRRLEIPRRTSRIAGRVTAGVIAAGVIAAGVIALSSVDDPLGWPGDKWADFKGGYDPSGFGNSRFGGDLGSNRYDFWRVAIDDEFAASPVIGKGSDNFAVSYLQHRDSVEEPLYPHSLPLRILAGTGLVGAVLFAGFAIAALAAAFRNRRRGSPAGMAGVAAIALAATAYLALHSAGDWLWSFPAITAPVFAWLGIASGPSRDAGDPPITATGGSSRPAGLLRVAIPAAGLILTAVLAASIVLPWFAARNVDIASASWRADPDAAFERLDRAAGLNFLSAKPYLTAMAIASQLGDRERLREYSMRALEREPTSWYAKLELGAVEALEGRRSAALRILAEAWALNPGDLLIREEESRVRRRKPMKLAEIDQSLLARVCAVVGRTDETTFCK